MGRMYGIAVLYGLVLVGMAGWCWCTWRAGVGVHGGLVLVYMAGFLFLIGGWIGAVKSGLRQRIA
jgi:hypothetical protein